MKSAKHSSCPRITVTKTLLIILAISCSVSGFTSAPHVSSPLHSSSGLSWDSSARASNVRLALYHDVEDAISEAEQICSMDPNSSDCKVAWDIVEELEAADSHRGRGSLMDHYQPMQSNQADLGAFLASLDILISKIDGKLDQLKATSYKLQELGASDPAIANLSYRADEMKEAMIEARNSLR